MKIRTDFVTNSSSSSYITITLNGTKGSVKLTGGCDDFSYPVDGLLYGEIDPIISKDTKTIDQMLSNLREAYGTCFEDAFAEEHDGFAAIDDAETIIFEEEADGDISYSMLEEGYGLPDTGLKVVGKYTVKTGKYASKIYFEDDEGRWKKLVIPE